MNVGDKYPFTRGQTSGVIKGNMDVWQENSYAIIVIFQEALNALEDKDNVDTYKVDEGKNNANK